jgi:hypothetical protein
MNSAKQAERQYIDMKGGECAYLADRLQLITEKQDGWVVRYCHKPDGSLHRLFWQNPRCSAWAQTYGQVLFMDTSERKNRYNMPLTTILVINGRNQSRNIAWCISTDSTEDTYRWILECLKHTIEVLPIEALKSRGTTVPSPVDVG